MSGLVLLAAENSRAKCYIQNLVRNGVPLLEVILLDSPARARPEQNSFDSSFWGGTNQIQMAKLSGFNSFFNQKESVESTTKKHGIKLTKPGTSEVNSPEVLNCLSERKVRDLLYCGPGGVILRKELISKCDRVLHVHPGKLPEFRGSTTIYYSILAGKTICATLIQMDSGIDTGPTIFAQEFEVPSSLVDVDYVFDPILRTEVLIAYLKQSTTDSTFKNLGCSEAISGSHPIFFIIHPVLKHLAIKKQRGGW